jgi:hypothetical protein
MKRLAPMALIFALFAAACTGAKAVSLGDAPSLPNPSPSGAGSPSSSPPVTSPPTTPSTQSSPAPPFTYEVWFAQGGKLFLTTRTDPFTPGIGRLALASMLSGPTGDQRGAGVDSAIPGGTELLDLVIEKGVATVDLSSQFESRPSDPPMALRLAQVVYTIGQFSTVQSVRFRIDGASRTVIGGVPVQGTQSMKGYESLLPAIVVESPSIGSPASSPLSVSGSANVFEATVSIRILDEDGSKIAETFTNASCGTGCRGDYSVAVRFSVDHEQPGIVEVFDYSAKDGSQENVVRIPVVLAP